MPKISFKLSNKEYMIKNVEKFENLSIKINEENYVKRIPTPFEDMPPNWGLWSVAPKCVTNGIPGNKQWGVSKFQTSQFFKF